MDTSSLFRLFFSSSPSKARTLESSSITDLTSYEVGNVLWKRKDSNINNRKTDELRKISSEISEVLDQINKIALSPKDLPQIFEIATTFLITFYDASYIFQSKKLNLSLVTEDKKMYEVAKKLKVHVLTLSSLQANNK